MYQNQQQGNPVAQSAGQGSFCMKCNATTPDLVVEKVSVVGWVVCVLTFPFGLIALCCCKQIVGTCSTCGISKWERSK